MNERFNNFSTLIDFFKANQPEKKSQSSRFNDLLLDFRQLTNKLHGELETRENRSASFFKLTGDCQKLKQTVYPIRYNETQRTLDENSEEIFFSCFELMEHNYRENSHSNILRHLFHHKFWNLGKEILSKFVFQATNDKEIESLILKANYEIYREFPIKAGRIDLLIEDKKNNFVIVIENKILAGIAVKEYNEDNTVSKTQLHNYINFVSANYVGYKAYYIILSLEPEMDIELDKFIQTNYNSILEILKNIKTENNIATEYKVLLKSIINYKYDKEWLIEISNKLRHKKNISSLNTFELVNKYF